MFCTKNTCFVCGSFCCRICGYQAPFVEIYIAVKELYRNWNKMGKWVWPFLPPLLCCLNVEWLKIGKLLDFNIPIIYLYVVCRLPMSVLPSKHPQLLKYNEKRVPIMISATAAINFFESQPRPWQQQLQPRPPDEALLVSPATSKISYRTRRLQALQKMEFSTIPYHTIPYHTIPYLSFLVRNRVV